MPNATGSNFMDAADLRCIMMRHAYHRWCDIRVLSG
jgi:hypothetical protein